MKVKKIEEGRLNMILKIRIFKRMDRSEDNIKIIIEELKLIQRRLKNSELIFVYTKEEFYKKFKNPDDFYKSLEWKEVRKRVFIRDEHKCRVCGKVGTVAHHLNSAWFVPEMAFDIENVMCFCRGCHAETRE